MNIKGLVRRLDALGRIVIPKEYRDMLHLSTEDPMEMFVVGDTICIKRHYSTTLCIDMLNSLTQEIKESSDNFYGVHDEIVAKLEETLALMNEHCDSNEF